MSVASVLIDEGLNKVVDDISAASTSMQTDASLLSQIEILTSARLASVVVDKLKLDQNQAFMNPRRLPWRGHRLCARAGSAISAPVRAGRPRPRASSTPRRARRMMAAAAPRLRHPQAAERGAGAARRPQLRHRAWLSGDGSRSSRRDHQGLRRRLSRRPARRQFRRHRARGGLAAGPVDRAARELAGGRARGREVQGRTRAVRRQRRPADERQAAVRPEQPAHRGAGRHRPRQRPLPAVQGDRGQRLRQCFPGLPRYRATSRPARSSPRSRPAI